METLTTKEAFITRLHKGIEPAVDYLYTQYSSMLFGFILQFFPHKKEAEHVLMLIFDKLPERLPEAGNSALGPYCWLQSEARKIILEYKQIRGRAGNVHSGNEQSTNYYLPLLQQASEEHRIVFIELYMNGRTKEEVAAELHTGTDRIQHLLRESLLILRNNL